ncbi:pirin family protein [Leptospira jelokensis]|uniref:Pirin family protein n=1 Tax=Leptospira jelokensis TaxID=2484931 RepID=A0A4Z0ZYT7_9LEPT|nr:pirin family protein [Leptospira jelokensis]TGL65365.1 hypothetical protein EHQ62_12385 [Leptospira jelokensis]
MEIVNRFKVEMVSHKHTESFSTHGFRCPKSINPFLNLDLFHMSMPTFPPHPHAGFSAVTYLFPTSEGVFQNRDSKGDTSIIEAGGLHWTQAGEGMFHEEIPTKPGVNCFGLQMFVKLPKQFELLEGKAFHVSPKDIPKVQAKGSSVLVILGSFGGVTNEIEGLKPSFQFLNVQMDPNADIELDLNADRIQLVVCIQGKIKSDADEMISSNEILILKDQTKKLMLNTFEEGCNFLFLSAPKLEEDYVWNGSLCLSDSIRMQETVSKLRTGQLGYLSSSF